MSRLLKALQRIEIVDESPDDEPAHGWPLAQDAALAGPDWQEPELWLPIAESLQALEHGNDDWVPTDDGPLPVAEIEEQLPADELDWILPIWQSDPAADLPAADTADAGIESGTDHLAACAALPTVEPSNQPPADAVEPARGATTPSVRPDLNRPSPHATLQELQQATDQEAEQRPVEERKPEPPSATESAEQDCPLQPFTSPEPLAGTTTAAALPPTTLLPTALLPAAVPFVSTSDRPYRQACEEILAALPESGAQAVVLAAADEDLDHSAAIVHLARVMAERLDDPVLLVDAGKRGRLSELLEAAAPGRVSEVLAGTTPWRELIVQTATAGLCVLPAAADDFAGDPVAVARLLDSCKQDFRLVLVAGHSGLIAEGLLAACDAAVLLLELGHTARPTAVAAADWLASGGSPVLGCLATAANLS